MDKFFRLLPVCLALSVIVAWFFPLAALGARFGWWSVDTAFLLLGGASLSAALLLAISGVALLLGIARQNDKAKHRAALIALVILVPLSFVFYHGVKAGQVPSIHDISTDRDDPPAFRFVLAQRSPEAPPPDYTADTAALQAAAHPQIAPLQLALSPAEALARAEAVARTLGWTVVQMDPVQGVLEATDTSFWFGFVDDVVVRIRAVGEQSRVDVRSASRIRRGNLDRNAARIEAFLTRMAGASG